MLYQTNTYGWPYKALWFDLLLSSGTALSNIFRREYSLEVHAVKTQLPSSNEVSLALEGWTSTSKLAIMLVMVDYMDPNWALQAVKLALDEVDRLYFSFFESWIKMICQGSTYWGMASCSFQGSSWPFWACQWPFTCNYTWLCFLKSLDDSGTGINPWGLPNRVACIEEPYTMHNADYTAGYRCIHETSRCKRPHQALGCPWAWSAIWRH